MSEVREYAMILQTIMLTNFLNNNDSYVCNSILYVRFSLNAIWSTTISNRDLIIQRFLHNCSLQSMVLHNIWIWYRVYTYTCSAFINVWHNTLIHPLTRCKNFSFFFSYSSSSLVRWVVRQSISALSVVAVL